MPFIDGRIMLEVGELDLPGSRPAPFKQVTYGRATNGRIDLDAFIPQATRVPYLGGIAAEEYRSEFFIGGDVPKGLQEHSP